MADEPPVSPETPTPTPEKKSHTTRNALIIVLVIVVILALFFGLFFGLRGCDNDNPNDTPDPDDVNPDPDIVEPGPVEEPEHTHTYGDWQYDDTYHWKECECGDVIDKEEHTLGYTDNNDGETHTIYCKICGYETTGEHTWSVTNSTPATCTTSGTTYYECEFCNATKTEVIQPLGHNPSSEWSSNTEGHWHVCLRCDEKLDYADHTLVYRDNGDGTHTQYCSVCNYEIKTESHDIEYSQISGDDTYHTESCKYCNYSETKAHAFDGYVSDGDAGHHQVCTECEYTTTTVSHNFGSYIADGENGHYQECSDCSYRTNDEKHNLSYESVDDTYHHQACSECSYTTESEEHNYETTNITDINLTDVATGEATATYEYTCTECEHTKTETNQPYTLNFATDPWNVIDQVSSAGYAKTYYSIGDTKTITINSESHNIRIIGFDHDDLTTNDTSYNSNSGKAAITVEMVDCLSYTRVMNSQRTNSGGWYSCGMRTYLSGTILPTLDNDLQAVIKKVDKKSTKGSVSTSLDETASDSLFLLAEVEVGGSGDGYDDEGELYAYYSEHNNDDDRVKTVNGTANVWWLRSPNTDAATGFRGVAASGSLDYATLAATALGVSFAFCI